MGVEIMTFEERLATRVKELPTKPFTDKTVESVLRQVNAEGVKSARTRHRKRLGIGSAAVTAVVLGVLALYSLNLIPVPSIASRRNFQIVVGPSSVTPTPLDTEPVGTVLKDYLARHSLSVPDSQISLDSLSDNKTLPVINTISTLAIRWSQITNAKYGGVIATFMANNKPRMADVVLVKSQSGAWNVGMVNVFPDTISSAALSKYPIYPGEWSGNDLGGPGNIDRIQYTFLTIFITDPSITRVEVVRDDGSTENLPIVNGVCASLQVAPPGNDFYGGGYKIRAYNRRGEEVAKLG